MYHNKNDAGGSKTEKLCVLESMSTTKKKSPFDTLQKFESDNARSSVIETNAIGIRRDTALRSFDDEKEATNNSTCSSEYLPVDASEETKSIANPFFGDAPDNIGESEPKEGIEEDAKNINISLETIKGNLPAAIISSDFETQQAKKLEKKYRPNEKEGDVSVFFCRVEEASARKDVSAHYSYAKDDSDGIKEEVEDLLREVNPFLRSFEDLDIEEKDDDEDEVEVKAQNTSSISFEHDDSLAKVPKKVSYEIDTSPSALIEYFTSIDQRHMEGKEKSVKNFQRLIIPLLDGKKPSIIEEAQIREAALVANVHVELVDKFISYVNEEHPDVVPQLSSEKDRNRLLMELDETEDLNEDTAVAAFLSSKFSTKIPSSNCKHNHGKEETVSNCSNGQRFTSCNVQNVTAKTSIKMNSSTVEKQPVIVKKKTLRSCELPVFYSVESAASVEISQSINELNDREIIEIQSSVSMKTNNIGDKNKNQPEKELVGVDPEIRKNFKRVQYYDSGIWQRRMAMAKYGWGWEEATWFSPRLYSKVSKISVFDGVGNPDRASNFMFNKKTFPFSRKNCKLPYRSRTNPHGGFSSVDVNSLRESSTVGEKCPIDETPWELRYVKQRFLHEKSLSFSRNWFGNLVIASGNDIIDFPVCKPKSMEMPMGNIPDPGDWTPEWYTTWGRRKLQLPRSCPQDDIDSYTVGTDGQTYDSGTCGSGTYMTYSTYGDYDDEDDEWEEAPECGTLVNTRQKIGEHLTKVHPDFTSSLRKSRWRKKYFPAGTFPY